MGLVEKRRSAGEDIGWGQGEGRENVGRKVVDVWMRLKVKGRKELMMRNLVEGTQDEIFLSHTLSS